MSRITASLAIIVIILLMVLSTPIYLHPQEKPPTIETYFSSKGGCTDAVIRELTEWKP